MQRYSKRVASMSSAALRREGPPGKPRAVIIPETRPPPGHALGSEHQYGLLIVSVIRALYSDTILLAVGFNGLQ